MLCFMQRCLQIQYTAILTVLTTIFTYSLFSLYELLKSLLHLQKHTSLPLPLFINSKIYAAERFIPKSFTV